jgi:hypothetical protein
MADAGTSTITFQASKIGIVQRIRSILVTLYLLELVGELSWRLLAGPRAESCKSIGAIPCLCGSPAIYWYQLGSLVS